MMPVAERVLELIIDSYSRNFLLTLSNEACPGLILICADDQIYTSKYRAVVAS